MYFLNDYILLNIHTDSNNLIAELLNEIKKNFSDTITNLTTK